MSDAMVVDSSAFVALLLGEPEQVAIARAIAAAAEVWASSFSILETAIVIGSKKGPQGLMAWDALVQRLAIEVVPLSSIHVTLAREAWLRFGKGRHAAGLNIGDCCSYAVAQHAGLPLLFKGEAFAKTDVTPVRLGP
ncbi:MAG: type II toxin-antitoxin system VapC family toxin [Myxococcota bacterium]